MFRIRPGSLSRTAPSPLRLTRASLTPPMSTARLLCVLCCADGMPWKFVPTQRSVRLHPGQSTLAFYTAHNKSDKAVTGEEGGRARVCRRARCRCAAWCAVRCCCSNIR